VDGGVNGTTRTVEGIFVVKSTRRLALEGKGARFRRAMVDVGSESRPIDLSTGAERSVARDATVYVRECARSVDAHAAGRRTSSHRSMRRSRCVRPCVGKWKP